MLRLLTVLFALLQLSSGLQLGGVRANVQLRRSGVSPVMGVSFKVGDTVEMITGDYKGAPACMRQQEAEPSPHWPQLGAPSQTGWMASQPAAAEGACAQAARGAVPLTRRTAEPMDHLSAAR